MPSRFSHRLYLRYAVRYPVIFGASCCVGEGYLLDLSFRGCSIHGDRRLSVGEPVRLGVLLSDRARALSIENGIIKWVDDGRFGVEFLDLSLDVRQRLNHELRGALIHRLERSS
ncbi:MAG: PilZ domain-containing protein [Nitrospira sp.]|nr:PilZ domain-containing protein [Nitrospira sp.]MCP9443309.1 PilZ domain-containing protein [Nitrospira sp.]